MMYQFGTRKPCIDINREVNISPPLTDKEAYLEWKRKSLGDKKEEKEEVENK